jgi:hypothetical protein
MKTVNQQTPTGVRRPSTVHINRSLGTVLAQVSIERHSYFSLARKKL